ncbi:MAG: MATE family efflux transporter [Alcaligenaceae bacterium]|nr:MATE family efflux transporter [Alcaligenaceae bacterium]
MTSTRPAAQPGHPIREILRQAWPVLISAWAGIAFAVLDTAMVGHTTAADLQAMSLAVSIYITVFISLTGVVHALIPIIAQHFGGRRHEQVSRAWGQGVWMALGLSVVGGACMVYPDAWLSMSGSIDPDVRRRIAGYLHALILALPAALVFRTIYALGTAISQPRVVMTINLASIAAKLLFNWLLIFGVAGLPAMGAVGAGLSTAIVSWLTLAAGLWAIRHQPAFAALGLRLGRPHWADQKELLRLGIPMGGSYLIEVCAFSFMSLLIARGGVFVSGGQQIMANLIALCYMMPMALGISSASLTAQAIGARDHVLARRMGRAGITLAVTGALLTAIVLITGQDLILRLYTNEAQVAIVAAALLQIAPWFHFWDAMHCISSYLLRAYKVAVIPLILQVTALTGLGLIGGWWLGFGPAAGAIKPAADWLMPGAPTGAATMWIMAMLGLAVTAVMLFVWYGHVVHREARRQA